MPTAKSRYTQMTSTYWACAERASSTLIVLSPSVFTRRPRYSRPWQTLFSGSCIAERSHPVFTTWTISIFSERRTQVSAQRTLLFARATAAGFQLPQKLLKGPASCLEFLGLDIVWTGIRPKNTLALKNRNRSKWRMRRNPGSRPSRHGHTFSPGRCAVVQEHLNE